MSATPVQGGYGSGDTDGGAPVKVGGKYNAAPPTFTDGQRGDAQLDTRGNLKVTVVSSNSATSAAFGYIADSASTGANVTAPTAAGIIAGLSAPPAGTYELRFSASVGAGAVAADNGNVKLLYNGATQINGIPTNGAEQVVSRIALNGTNVVQLQAIGNGTAAVVYTGRVTATRIA